MRQREGYLGIDLFRILAAFMVVAIHTWPLASVSPLADLVVTRILCRVAVPFFFMATGFFLLPAYLRDKKTDYGSLLRFLKKTLLLYAVSTALYLPISIYAGNFQPGRLVQDLLFNGIFYHLWYLPAAMLGAALVCFLLKHLTGRQAFSITAVLYVIGLFGDSYYGIVAQFPALAGVYDALFLISDYTRNGLFFTPIFLLLGGWLSLRQGKTKPVRCYVGLLVSLVLMVAEGLAIHHFSVQRHDSMYVMLLPVMFFLFQCLLFWRGPSSERMRKFATGVYILHPAMILLVRVSARVTGTWELFVENSVGHYIAVAAASAVAAYLIAWLLGSRKKTPPAPPRRTRRAWTEVDLDALTHNMRVFESILPKNCTFMAVLKANAYGHGDVAVARHLQKAGAKAFAVATLDEGIRLREAGIRQEILVLGYTPPDLAGEIAAHGLTQTVVSYHHGKELAATGQQLLVHLKVDTGMHRLGTSFEHPEELAKLMAEPNLKVTGIFTHLCAADTLDERMSRRQIERFYKVLEQLPQGPKIHIQSSYGVLNYPELNCDYARVGIGLYGVYSASGGVCKTMPDLHPALALKTRVAMTRQIAAGESVGYGCRFTAKQDSRIAVLPIGYADGYPRSLSCGGGRVLIRGKEAPVIGRICMDQMMVDITWLPDVREGDTATLIGRDGDAAITAEAVAAAAGTITNELLSRLGERLERVYLEQG